jgi:hypothetical protein
VTTAFDISDVGTGVLDYRNDPNRAWWRVAQTILWLAVLVVAAGARSPFGRRRSVELHDETLIDLSQPPTGIVHGEALGTPVWGDPDEGAEHLVGPPVASDEPDPTPPVDGGPDAVGDRPDPPRSFPVAAPPVDAVADPPDDDDEVDLAALVARVDDVDHSRDPGPPS